MSKPTLTLYTSKPSDGGFLALAARLARHQPVQLRDLAELPAPNPKKCFSAKGDPTHGN